MPFRASLCWGCFASSFTSALVSPQLELDRASVKIVTRQREESRLFSRLCSCVRLRIWETAPFAEGQVQSLFQGRAGLKPALQWDGALIVTVELPEQQM